jgi:hypothetical protein
MYPKQLPASTDVSPKFSCSISDVKVVIELIEETVTAVKTIMSHAAKFKLRMSYQYFVKSA